MGLQSRLALTFVTCLALMAGIGEYAMRLSFAENYAGMERREAMINLARLVQGLEGEFNHLANFARDYGHWTETYDFARGKNASWAAENGQDALSSSRTSLIAVILPAGEISHFEASQQLGARMTPAQLSRYATALRAPGKAAGCGLMQATDALLLTCWTDIRRNDSSGGDVGSLVMARQLDAEFIERLRRQTHLAFSFAPASYAPAQSPTTPHWTDTLPSPALGGSAVTARAEPDLIRLDYPLRDVRGEAQGHLVLELQREIIALGETDFAKVREQFFWTLLICGLLLAIAVHMLVVRRLRSLQRRLLAITDHSSWQERICDTGRDELGDVARSTNRMLDTIQRQMIDLDRANAVLGHMVANQSEQLAVADESLAQIRQEYEKAYPLATLAAVVPALAHDLNTPVGNIAMAAQTIDDKVAAFRAIAAEGAVRRSDLDALVSTVGDGMRIIESANARVGDLVRGLKHMSVDQATHRRRRYRLDELVDEVLTTLKPTLRRQGVQVATAIPAGLEMDSYPGPLGQVLTNLLQNAHVHAFDGRDAGQVTISAETSGGDVVTIKVEDNGAGMGPDTLSRIFEPFFTTKAGQGGSGIGLTFSRRLVEESLGGRLLVNSVSGQGTCFTLELPATAPLAEG